MKTEEWLLDTDLDNDFVPKAQATKENSKWDSIQPKSFGTATEVINTTKRQPMEWEKHWHTTYLIRG